MIGHKIICEVQSSYNGQIRVYSDFGNKYISTGQLTQSGGLVKDVWEPVLKKYGRKYKSWLILGLAGGTIAGIISHKLSPEKIVGVEIDPVMLELGKKYLGLSQIKKLEIILSDAKAYLAGLNHDFDYILVDTYIGDQLPSFVYTSKFLKQLKLHGPVVIINHLFYDPPKKILAEKLISSLKLLFSHIQLIRKLTNILIVCYST